MKTWHKGHNPDWHDSYMRVESEAFEHYIEHGFRPRAISDDSWRSAYVAEGPYGKWDDISDAISMYANLCEYEFQSAGTAEGRFDRALALRTFAAFYLNAVTEVSKERGYNMDGLSFVAFGTVLGCHEQAFTLARIFFKEWRGYGWRWLDNWPLYTFLVNLLVDYLGEQPWVPIDMFDQPSLVDLLHNWRNADAEAIAEACVGICDLHTHATEDAEYADGSFAYFPLEVLLAFRLRELLGLKNPTIDHPMMQTALGQLPAPIDFGYDGILLRVYERMVKEGFDDRRILEKHDPRERPKHPVALGPSWLPPRT